MKQKYRKPVLKEIKLAVADAVLTSCKITMTASSASKRCLEQSCKNSAKGS
jgi:hypothetical protein